MVRQRQQDVNLQPGPTSFDAGPGRPVELGDACQAENEVATWPDPPYGVITGHEPHAPENPQEWGIYAYKYKPAEVGVERQARQLTNFHVCLDRDLEIVDGLGASRKLTGRLVLRDEAFPFSIAAEDFFDSRKLHCAVGAAAGAAARIMGSADELRDAISWLNYHGGRWQPPVRQTTTTRFGWNDAGDAFLAPSGRITAAGFAVVTPADGICVDLSGYEWACHLDLLDPVAGEPLHQLHRHLVDDLLQLHEPTVTYCLLGATALAVLDGFAPGDGKLVLWLVGPTGSSKSFTARRFQHFFGRFPEEGIANWTSTANYIEQSGYYFANSLYLVDDFKPENCQRKDVVRVIQAYADLTSRGRLRSDGTASTKRYIRGLLVVTGEDIVVHTASALARSITVPVASGIIRQEQGRRCLGRQDQYPRIVADFIRWVMATGQPTSFQPGSGHTQTRTTIRPPRGPTR